MDDTVNREQIRYMIQLLESIHTLVQPKPKRQHKVTAKSTGFDEFWKLYPKKVAIGEAEKAWAKVNPDAAMLAKILAAVQRQAKSEKWREDGGKFIPNPATWLNARRWEDQVVSVAQTQNLPPVMHKPTPSMPVGVPPPPEVAAALSRLLGKDMSFIGGKR